MATICFSLYIPNSHRYLLRTLDCTLAKQASELLAIATTITTRYDTVINEPQKAGINIFDEIRAATFSLSHSFHCYSYCYVYTLTFARGVCVCFPDLFLCDPH